ncbi:MAG: hypothetical protein JO053_01700 [Acidobacteria bacterium]|nr:hypothetical protein [Acidobacteriota bacterium]
MSRFPACRLIVESRTIAFVHEEECSDLKREADKAADEYFPVVTKWAVTGGRDEELRKKARARAGVFRRSLDWLIECYKRIQGSWLGRRRLEDAVQMKQLVEKDIAALNRYAPNPDPTPPE